MILNSSYPKEVLEAIDNMPIRELYIKLELLDWQENIIKEIQGLLTGGNISINGNSAVRRTCSFTFVVEDETIQQQLKLNSKFKLYIGLKNKLSNRFKDYGDIFWFKGGMYVFVNASFTHNASTLTVNVTAKDKMCLLNGEVGGTIADTAILHERYEIDENNNTTISYPTIFQIIQELVNHYGNEALQNIFINNIPDEARQLMRYNGSRPLYLRKIIDESTGKESYAPIIYFDVPQEPYKTFYTGDLIGYTMTDFTFPGELIANPGDSIVSILDKIKNMLGNFEYFYDLDGHFIFQEIRNYQNNSYIPLTELDLNRYQANFDIDESIYSFVENSKLINSYANNPQYGNIKNDFVVWGKSSKNDLPIRYHLAIDTKPPYNPNSGDWREELYQYGLRAEKDGIDAGYYWKELKAEWRKLYSENNQWEDVVTEDPASIDYFLDFIDANSAYGEWSIENIGRRTISIVDNDCVCVYQNEIPDVIFIKSSEEKEIIKLRDKGYTICQMPDSFFDAIRIAANGKSCYDKVRELLYQHLTLNESITVNSLPIYWLEPNCKIEVEDDKSRIYGQYMIKSISLPLTFNGTMNIQATRALSRL